MEKKLEKSVSLRAPKSIVEQLRCRTHKNRDLQNTRYDKISGPSWDNQISWGLDETTNEMHNCETGTERDQTLLPVLVQCCKYNPPPGVICLFLRPVPSYGRDISSWRFTPLITRGDAAIEKTNRLVSKQHTPEVGSIT